MNQHIETRRNLCERLYDPQFISIATITEQLHGTDEKRYRRADPEPTRLSQESMQRIHRVPTENNEVGYGVR